MDRKFLLSKIQPTGRPSKCVQHHASEINRIYIGRELCCLGFPNGKIKWRFSHHRERERVPNPSLTQVKPGWLGWNKQLWWSFVPVNIPSFRSAAAARERVQIAFPFFFFHHHESSRHDSIVAVRGGRKLIEAVVLLEFTKSLLSSNYTIMLLYIHFLQHLNMHLEDYIVCQFLMLIPISNYSNACHA